MRTERASVGGTGRGDTASLMLVSVVVPTYRRPEYLERCLGALVMQDFDHKAYEIVVCDDAASGATREQVERWAAGTRGTPQIRYIPVRETQGPAGARNRGWRAARGLIIAFTDDDTVPHPDWIEEGWKAMATGPAAAAGRVMVPFDRASPTDYERDIGRMEAAEFVTANCFVRRDALAAVGGFDERFTAAWREDSDLQFSLMKVGRVIRAHNAVVKHPVRPVARWTETLRAHRKVAFDALLYKKHPQLYRQRIRRHPPWNYYLITLGLAGIVAGALLASPLLAVGASSLWLGLTAAFASRRLEGTSRDGRHVREVVLSSLVIPVVAVYWRLVGAFRYRVFFL